MPEQQNITNIPSNRVEIIDPRTGLVSREWYRFFINLFNLAGAGGNQTSLDDLQIGPPSDPTAISSGGGTGTVTSVSMTVPTGLTVSGSPITTAGTLAVTYSAGYSIPTTIKQTEWDTAYSERQQWDGGATNLVAATGRTSLGATTVGGNFFTLTNPSAITFVQINADNSITTMDAPTFRTAIGAGTGSGTITSVTGTSPVASSGGTTPDISLASGYGDTQNPYASKTANYVLAAPNGLAGVPTFRALVSADIPALSYVSSVGVTAPITTTGGLTPTIGITQATTSTNGYLSSTDWNTFNNKQAAGTYVTTISVATANGFAGSSSGGATPTLTLSTSVTGVLKGNGTAISAATAGTDYSAGTSALATGILKSTTTTGALSIAVAGDFPTLNQNTTGTASNVTGVVAIANGGTGQSSASAGFNALSPITSTGDLIIGNGVNSATRLGIGLNNYVLTSNGTTATWAPATGSGATITNDTSTATNVWPLFANATSGSLATAYTSDAKLLYKPSIGELTSPSMVCSNGIQLNSNTVASSYTIAAGNNGLSAGPVSVSTGITVTVSSGSVWTIV